MTFQLLKMNFIAGMMNCCVGNLLVVVMLDSEQNPVSDHLYSTMKMLPIKFMKLKRNKH